MDTNVGIDLFLTEFRDSPIEYSHVKPGDTINNEKAQEVEEADIDMLVFPPAVERPKIEDILGVFQSGIGLDISKNHTGVAMWYDGKLETFGFAVDMTYEKNSYLAEARMRNEFKTKLRDLLSGRKWEVCIVEDVYGGTNFDTTRKLLALNCVVDELVLEEQLQIDYIYRFKEAEWLKDLRTIANVGKRLNPKYETQRILEYLSFDFLLEHDKDRKADKERIFFEDRCDATGQLLALAMRLSINDREIKESSVRLRDLKMFFLEDADETLMLSDDIVRHNEIVLEDFPEGMDIEGALLTMAEKHPKNVISILVDTSKLGVFGVKNGFTFFEQGYGYLVFYNKRTLKG